MSSHEIILGNTFEMICADLNRLILSNMTPETATLLTDRVIELTNFYFEAGTDQEAKAMEQIFLLLIKRLLALRQQGDENTQEYRQLHKELRVYENFIAYGRRTSGK